MVYSALLIRKRVGFGSCIFMSIVGALLLLSACSQATSSMPALRGHLLIEGSTALQPLTSAAASIFEKRFPQVHIEVNGGGSLLGLDAVSKQEADIGESDVYADPALYPDPDLMDHIVCIIPFTLISHPDVPLSTLTQQQILDIFVTGKLRNWDQLGGADLPIVPVVRSDTSGTRASFLKYVLNGESERKHLLQADSSLTMLHLVAQTPGAIGYMGLSSLDPSVHTLAMNGITATPKAIASGQYPFWGYEHMYTLSNHHNPVITAFLQFMLSSTIQEQARQMGYISLEQIQLPTPGSGVQENSSTKATEAFLQERRY